MTPETTAKDDTELEHLVRDFETLTGINIRAWARRVIPTVEYADIDSHVCERCGLRQSGNHRTDLECVIAFREVCFNLETENEQLRRENRNRGGMNRSDNHFVVLHGQRMCLTDAARELGLTFDALRCRIKRRAGGSGGEVDLDALGINKRYARRKGRAAEVHR
jgi:hypothetical protein